MDNLQNAVNGFKEELIQSVQDCIKIKSVSGDQAGTKKVLDFYLDLGGQMGFETRNIEDLGGIIEFGDGEKTIGIIVHLDTVPEGTGWNFPPFAGQVQDGKIFGRGAIDDKGPALAALYALKACKDCGVELKSKMQIIIGIDEESTWHTTPQLLKKIKEPDFSFVPDSKFPIVIAEKGLVWLEIQKDLQQNSNQQKNSNDKDSNPQNAAAKNGGLKIQNLQGGSESLNIVPDYCEATLQFEADPADRNLKQQLQDKLKEFTGQTGYDIVLEPSDNALKLISKGKAAHAFSCEEGRNAISQLILFLNQLDLEQPQQEFIDTYSRYIGLENYGESLGLPIEDNLTGKLTVSPGYLSLDDKQATLKIDLRFPASEHLETIKPKIEKAFALFNGRLTILDSLESLSFPENDDNIRKLLQVYQDFTGDTRAKPLGMGGTTFAKAFQRAVAFGPTFPGMAKVEHQPDEYMEIDHLVRCTEIYALAIHALAGS